MTSAAADSKSTAKKLSPDELKETKLRTPPYGRPISATGCPYRPQTISEWKQSYFVKYGRVPKLIHSRDLGGPNMCLWKCRGVISDGPDLRGFTKVGNEYKTTQKLELCGGCEEIKKSMGL